MSAKILKRINAQKDEEFVSAGEDIDDNASADGSDDDVNHSQLLTDIARLDPKTQKALKWKATRFEPKSDVNEYNLSKSDNQLSIDDLLKNVRETTVSVKKLKHWSKKRLLDEPLEKIVSDKIKRAVNYEVTAKELRKWDQVVAANRTAPQLQFPLKQEALSLEPSRAVVKHFRPKTKLELQVAELLNKSENNLTDDKPLTVAEEKIMKAMSLEEAKARHKELQKMRALLSYEEVRLKRQSKIKSKRYHRILKRERLKKSVEEFEATKKSDPMAAVEKLQELDKLRALERASLKHKNTGKWAKHLKLRSQYDDSAREALTEQLQISNKLTQRRVRFEGDDDQEVDASDGDDSDSGDDNEVATHKDNEFRELPEDYNPWMRSGRESRPNAEIIPEVEEEADEPINVETAGPAPTAAEEVEALSSRPTTRKRALDVMTDEDVKEVAAPQREAEIDPNDFIVVKAHRMKTSLPDMVTDMDSDGESVDESDGVSDDEQKRLVSEAFADDDVISDFKKAKKERIENESERDVNLHLPGWGQWGGNGLRVSKRRVKRFTVKAKRRPRKDNTIGNVIISETRDAVIGKYRVNQLPFPFKNVEEFENSIRQPLGRTWNPETAFKELTAPSVVTKMGAIIDPMDSEALVKSNPKRRVFRKRDKKKNRNNLEKKSQK
ncbi:unnamed protein product [Oppiella nova]|uniref:U3 small nucleolar RNA-associated protein 14 homolog A n=1 Tax=Oppiella nova TaxID=334625 RepID=A0A7R9Q999_9ACAR|nr:unnamed protein product [Oppiella nova]CAG2160014.1 unnamed protein product [Oppiella nova]